MVTVEDVRRLALSLPRTEEALVRDRVKFRVRGLVYKFLMPIPSDERYHWVRARLSALSQKEMRELVIDAWRMVVPKSVAAEHLGEAPRSRPSRARARRAGS
jgi:hypothetical protein